MLLLLLSGCALDRAHMDRALLAEKGSLDRNRGVREQYTLRCPDILLVSVTNRPELSAARPIGPDGRIDMGTLGRLRIEGRTVPEVTRLVAAVAGESPDRVQISVSQFNSQQVYLFGPGIMPQRSVPYRGQETVVDLLQRVGGTRPGAAPNHVYVVRPHVADNKAPEVFHADLQGILTGQDSTTNVRLQPFDEIHVGETRQASFEKYIPPLFRPLYESACGLRRRFGEKPPTEDLARPAPPAGAGEPPPPPGPVALK
jgi:protein involved in polysaccharide export with SLBB domain